MEDLPGWAKIALNAGLPMVVVAWIIVNIFKKLIPDFLKIHQEQLSAQAQACKEELAQQRADNARMLEAVEKGNTERMKLVVDSYEARSRAQAEYTQAIATAVLDDLKAMKNAVGELGNLIVFNVKQALEEAENEWKAQEREKMLEELKRERERHQARGGVER